ncbi:MAG: 30S ribosomal protein S8 [Candidatus Omnitrophica bacterium]|nr:30S ribosomal protein S8 [Candidatus Omnitrophota bacterium]
MPVTDPISDMLTVIRNAVMRRKEDVLIKRSKITENIVTILKREGFIANYKAITDNKQGLLKIYLKYDKENTPLLTGVERVSRPGRRIYVTTKDIKTVYSGIGTALISTSHGIMTDREAKEKKLGGEIICKVW